MTLKFSVLEAATARHRPAYLMETRIWAEQKLVLNSRLQFLIYFYRVTVTVYGYAQNSLKTKENA